MYQRDTEILFPMRVAPHLSQLRGQSWRELVERVCSASDSSLEHLAFSLMLIRLSGCLNCHTDCYRAMRGCTFCAAQTIRRFRGQDQELIDLYQRAVADVELFLLNAESSASPPLQSEGRIA